MGFDQFSNQQQVVQLLQRSLAGGRLAHAYLLTGNQLEELEAVARALAKTLNCQNPPQRGPAGLPLDACDQCLPCRKIEGYIHADVQWVRPESKIRIIAIDQIRELLQTVHLKPTEATFKVAVIVGADRLNAAAANAFLKTLEEPPANSILILLSTEPQRILETILSRCLRLSFAGSARLHVNEQTLAWVGQFAGLIATDQRSLLGRYRLLGTLMKQLAGMREAIEKTLESRSPMAQYQDADPDLIEKWETELTAATEAEYRRQRMELLLAFEWWLRDIWLHTMGVSAGLFTFPKLAATAGIVANRIQPEEAMNNLLTIEDTQRMLHTNAQEALVLEVGLLKLKL